jgi:hypothetical protein
MLCFRLFSENNPAVPLADAVAQLREGQAPKDLYAVEPASFQQIPNAPFAYWVSERVRKLFVQLPAYHPAAGTVRQGMATAYDERFLRLWLEVSAASMAMVGQIGNSDAQEIRQRCNEMSSNGTTWFPFAKGGVFSPYCQDLYLVGNWRYGGKEISNFMDLSTGKTRSAVRNPDYYFLPGYTYPLRARRMCVQVLPAGALISTRGSGIYGDTTGAHLALMNTTAFDGLIKLILGRTGHPQFDMGDINATPVPKLDEDSLRRVGDLGHECFYKKRYADTTRLTNHAFLMPAMAPSRTKKKSSRS